MTYNNIRNVSYSISVVFHLILLILFIFITWNIEYPQQDYVELSFGKSGEVGSSGAKGTQITKVEEAAKPEEKTEAKETTTEVKEVDLPEAKNTSDENIIKPAVKEKAVAEQSKAVTKEASTAKVPSAGQGNKAEGDGSFGYEIDWGGKGTRRIYSFIVPAYPEGVQKEIDIRLRFTILPDGTVGNIIPLIKADTRLENAAIHSLRQWRFEALDPNQKQTEQVAIIVFPYRLQ
jgi:outer membrane biosynthesis protein TonB